jgi:oxygen-independent coproporphyrinogen-3 oxidase
MAGLYIHIPFCGSRCAYCDFYSTTSPERVAGFLEALKREMTARKFGNLKIWKFENESDEKNNFQIFKSSNLQISTIYIGGGTPSLLAPEQLQGLLDHAASLWDCSAVREITLEANPEDLTGDYLSRLAETDFNRLSIGVQSFDDGLLRLMSRRHDAARAKEAVRAARRAGFDNISIDLIYGIPGMGGAQWERSLD